MKFTARTILLVAIGTLVLVGLVIANMNQPASPPHMVRHAASTTPPPPATPQLALLSSRGGSSSSAYYKVEGEVRNISSEPIRSIVAVATWYDKADQFISSDSGLVAFDPLMPGQTSPYSVLIRSNPLMHQYGVAFKTMGGEELRVEDRRKSSAKKK